MKATLHLIRAVLREFGPRWMMDRALYSLKLKALSLFPQAEGLFERRAAYPKRTDLFQLDVSALKSFLSTLEEKDRAQLVQTADLACRGVFRAFSSMYLDYGFPVDWQLNPITGKRCDVQKKWYRIPDFDPERGDIKVIWEASRFSHFLTLARAWLLTGQQQYYEAFSRQLDDWLRENPYGFGANFKCGQECALRMINTLLAFTVFRESGVMTQRDEKNLKELVHRCYKQILSNFFYAYRCIKNNHTISELMGMIAGAWCCGEDKQVDRAFRLLDKVVAEQFSEDGGYLQFSFNYQRLALQDMECVLSMEKQTGRRISSQSRKRIEKAALLMYQCMDDCGDMPNYGSNDGALAFPVTSCGYRDFLPTVNAAYALVTGRQLCGAGKHREELVWFTSGRGAERFSETVVERVSSQFPLAGLFTLRGLYSWAMFIANDYRTRPAHMDQLHVDLWTGGINVLCDGGTYSYADELGKRLVFNESHNTALVKGRPQMNMCGPFLIYDRTVRKLEETNDNAILAEIISANGYKHRRRIAQRDDCYQITDTVDTDCCLVFHTPCDISLDGKRAILSLCGKILCTITCSHPISKEEATRSLLYLEEERITSLRIHVSAGEVIDTRIQIRYDMKETQKND